MPSEKEIINQLAHLLEAHQFREVSLAKDNVKISFAKSQTKPAPAALAGEQLNPETHAENLFAPVGPQVAGKPISSPMMGIYYASPVPGAPPFVTIGAKVSVGQVVALIEAMKVFNEIVAIEEGIVISIEVTPGQVVKNGDTLMLIDAEPL